VVSASANPLALVIRVKEMSRVVGGIKNLKVLVDLLAEWSSRPTANGSHAMMGADSYSFRWPAESALVSIMVPTAPQAA
jgi:hypothetical protein